MKKLGSIIAILIGLPGLIVAVISINRDPGSIIWFARGCQSKFSEVASSLSSSIYTKEIVLRATLKNSFGSPLLRIDGSYIVRRGETIYISLDVRNCYKRNIEYKGSYQSRSSHGDIPVVYTSPNSASARLIYTAPSQLGEVSLVFSAKDTVSNKIIQKRLGLMVASLEITSPQTGADVSGTFRISGKMEGPLRCIFLFMRPTTQKPWLVVKSISVPHNRHVWNADVNLGNAHPKQKYELFALSNEGMDSYKVDTSFAEVPSSGILSNLVELRVMP